MAPEKLVHLTPAEAAKTAPDFLIEELPARIARGPVTFHLKAQLASPGDSTKDASTPWSTSDEVVELGVLTIDKSVPNSLEAQKKLLFLPGNLIDGIEPSDDPLIGVRDGLMRCRFRAEIRESHNLVNREFAPRVLDLLLLRGCFFGLDGLLLSFGSGPYGRGFVCPPVAYRLPGASFYLKYPGTKVCAESFKQIPAMAWRTRGAEAAKFGPENANRLMRFRDNIVELSFAMKSKSKHDHALRDAFAPEESRFEKLEAEAFFKTHAYAHFGRKLQKIFPLLPDNSEPEDVRALVRKIQAKLNNFRTVETGDAYAAENGNEREQSDPLTQQQF